MDGSPDHNVGEGTSMTPSSAAAAEASLLKSSRRYALGVILLLLVVFLWVGSSTLIQEIFVDQDFHQPLFLTYYSTSLFTLYLPVWALRQWLQRQRWWSRVTRCCRSEREQMRQDAVLLENGADSEPTLLLHSATASPGGQAQSSLLAGGSANGIHSSPRSTPVRPTPVLVSPMRSGERSPLTHNDAQSHHHSAASSPSAHVIPIGDSFPHDNGTSNHNTASADFEFAKLWPTARLALSLCPLWFLMNYLFNLSLNLTSLASSTILSTTSSLFVLLFGLCSTPRSSEVGLPQALGVAATILGAVLISWKDTGGGGASASATGGAGGSGGAKEDGNSLVHSLVGDLVAALSAVFYALYSLQLRRSIPDEAAVDMTLLFGFIGLSNTLCAWPLFPLLHVLQVEAWVGLPSAAVLGFLTLNGLAGTVVSDFLWAKSVLLTSPLIASLGLALTVPLAIVVDVLLNGKKLTLLTALGGFCVLAGFALVNLAHKKKIDQAEEAVAADADSATAAATSPSGSAARARGHSDSHSRSHSEHDINASHSHGTSPMFSGRASDDATLLDVSLSSPAHPRSARDLPASASQNPMHSALASNEYANDSSHSSNGAVSNGHGIEMETMKRQKDRAQPDLEASSSLESQLASALALRDDDSSDLTQLEQQSYEEGTLEHVLAGTPQSA